MMPLGLGLGCQIHVPKNAQALFNIALKTIIGNGMSTKFWADRWLQGKTVAELVPNLFQLIPKRTVKRRTIAQALNNSSWVADIKGALSVQVLTQYLLIWDLVDGMTLQHEVANQYQ